MLLCKQSRLVFPTNNHQSAALFDLVQVDLQGSYRFKIRDNRSIFLTLVEDKSRTTWVYLLSDKTVLPSPIKEFVSQSYSVQCDY